MVILIFWAILFCLSFGFLGFSYIIMSRVASRPWNLNIDKNYRPKVSIIVPTYNESAVIEFKLKNLTKLSYPKNLTQIIIVDSKSDDDTFSIVKKFIKQHSDIKIQVLIDNKSEGKSAALNFALKYCSGDVVIVSDADCFLPSDILNEALPFLTDKNVGAITGPKTIINELDSWVTKNESAYLKMMNSMKLGESKLSSTLFFEGGFSAYKKEFLDSFDPYHIGSDDCGTIIRMCEKGKRSIIVSEAKFFTSFPKTWRGKFEIKLRRITQLVRVFTKYASLLIYGRIRVAKGIILRNIYSYLLTPFLFVLLFLTTINLLWDFPYFAIIFLSLTIPKITFNVYEIIQSSILFFIGILYLLINKRTLFWKKPEDRSLLTEDLLRKYGLI